MAGTTIVDTGVEKVLGLGSSDYGKLSGGVDNYHGRQNTDQDSESDGNRQHVHTTENASSIENMGHTGSRNGHRYATKTKLCK